MGGFFLALHSDLYLLLRGRALAALMILPALAAFLRIVLGRLGTAREQAAAALQGAARTPVSENAYGPFVDGLGTGFTVLGFVAMVIAASSLSRDLELGTCRLALTRGISRSSWLLSRYLTLALATLGATATLIMAAGLGGLVFYDFGPVVEDGFEIFSEGEVRAEIVTGLWRATLPLAPTLALGLLISACSRVSGVAVAVGLVTTVLLDLFQNTVEAAGRYVYASYLPTLLDRSYLGEVSQLARGFSDVGFSADESWLNGVVPLPEALLFMGLAWLVVRRRRL